MNPATQYTVTLGHCTIKIMALKEYKKIVLDRLHGKLKARGFKKAGQIFRKTTEDLIYFISLQSSQQSTAKTLKMTVNLEIASMQIAKN